MRRLPDVVPLAMEYDQDHFDAGDVVPIDDRYFPVVKKPGWNVKMRMLDGRMNKVREYRMQGVVGEMILTDPSEEDRANGEAYFLACVLRDAGIDAEDLKEIAKWAQDELPDSFPDRDKATRLINAIGGAA